MRVLGYILGPRKGVDYVDSVLYSFTGPTLKDNLGRMETDSELQDSPGSDAPALNTLAQALSRQKRKRPGSASDLGDDSLEESGSGDHKETEDKHLEPAKKKEAVGKQVCSLPDTFLFSLSMQSLASAGSRD